MRSWLMRKLIDEIVDWWESQLLRKLMSHGQCYLLTRFDIPYFRLWSRTDGQIDGQRCMLLPQVLGTTCTTLLVYLYFWLAWILNICKIVTLFDIKRGQALVSRWCLPGSYYPLLCCFAIDWTTTHKNFWLKSIWEKSTQLWLMVTFFPITIIVERIIFIFIPFWVRSMEYFQRNVQILPTQHQLDTNALPPYCIKLHIR